MSIFDMFGKKQEAAQPPAEQPAAEEKQPELPPFAKKILVVVDGSKRAYDAANYAIALASHLPGCELCAAFVIDVASLDSLMQMHIFVKEERANFEAELETKGRRTLEYVRNEGQKYKIDIDTFLLKGRVTSIVMQAVRELKADLLVIAGWHNGSTRKDTSSVEYQLLLDEADCPVIVVK